MDADIVNIAPDPEAATDFLQEFAPFGLWLLIAIWPKGIAGIPSGHREIIAETFSPRQVQACRDWITKHNGAGWNVYFMINQPKQPMSKKATKEDVKEAAWFFVDLDPRAGEPLEEERERILKLLTENRPDDIPEPTLIIDSGSGFWGLWKLEQPISLTGEQS